jgi:hypothetical protein
MPEIDIDKYRLAVNPPHHSYDEPNPFDAEHEERHGNALTPVVESVEMPPPAEWVAKDTPPTPIEPGIGHVIAYTLQGTNTMLMYASLRAGDGYWYTTGGKSRQRATWAELIASMRQAGVSRYHLAAGWLENEIR